MADGESGILVPPANPARLAQAILGLINSPELREQMGATARARLEEKYSVEKMTLDTVQVYRKALRRETNPLGQASLDVRDVIPSK